MNMHENARMTFHGRALLVRRVREERWRVSVAAEAAGISRAHGLQLAGTTIGRAASGCFTTGARRPPDARTGFRPLDRGNRGLAPPRRSGPKIANALGLLRPSEPCCAGSASARPAALELKPARSATNGHAQES